jgi:hypothetical protein
MTALLRIFLLLAMIMVIRGYYRAWRVESARARERRRAAKTDRFDNPSDQAVSDADFEEIP